MHPMKAAIFDVDGTLFDYRNQEIPASTVAAVQKLKDRGRTVIVATARSYPELSEDLLTKIDADYYVAASGHSILDRSGRVLSSIRFTHEQVEIVKALAVEFDAGLTLKYEDRSCLYRHPEQMMAIYCNIGQPRCPSMVCPTLDYHRAHLPMGFTVWGENGIREQIRQALSAYPRDFRMELFGNGTVADIYSPRANKMTALSRLVEDLGLEPEMCMAFGDSRNDLEMIRWAGLGVAMGNACQELKDAADAVCGATWEDGIAEYLQTHIFSE